MKRPWDGMGREVGGGSGWGTCVHLWRMHVDVWQIQYNIVNNNNKFKKKKKIKKEKTLILGKIEGRRRRG